MNASARTDAPPPWLAFALLAALAATIAAPGPAFFDSGELAATAIELGVPHPTGFPVFNLLGHLCALLPLGPIATRVHLAGGMAAAAAAVLWLTTLGVRAEAPGLLRPGTPIRGAVWLALLAAPPLLAPAVTRHVRAAEVYPLVWLHAAVVVTAMVRLRGGRRAGAVLALVAIAASIHAEAVLIAGVALLVAAVTWWRGAAAGQKLVIFGVRCGRTPNMPCSR